MQIYNSMTRKKEEFKPIHEGKVGIYACGPTVYNYFHIGNARPFIVFDVLRRYFEYKGYEVTFVQNFTDIDDKMIRRANEENTTVAAIAEKYIGEYFVDAKALGIRPATVHPRATEHMPQIIAMIQKLVDKGLAYESNGDVYYRVKAFENYGCLCGQNLEDLASGARVSVDEQKEDPLDFALWKARKEESEIAWESPWSMGRPGWHIECSTMAKKHLGETIDIHGGGQDLTFPHHENEIAQSEACCGNEFAKYWMHNAFLNIDNKKMSKSLGNFFTVREISEKYDLQILRFFMLNAHYRSPLNFSADLMESSKNALERIQTAVDNLKYVAEHAASAEMTAEESAKAEEAKKYEANFDEAMDDDFNTADAIAAVFDLVKFANTSVAEGSSKAFAEALCGMIQGLCDILGIITEKKEELLDADIENLIAERQAARKAKNFARADEIRGLLLEKGIILEDTREGVKWKRA